LAPITDKMHWVEMWSKQVPICCLSCRNGDFQQGEADSQDLITP